jgi:hypothetical protein
VTVIFILLRLVNVLDPVIVVMGVTRLNPDIADIQHGVAILRETIWLMSFAASADLNFGVESQKRGGSGGRTFVGCSAETEPIQQQSRLAVEAL